MLAFVLAKAPPPSEVSVKVVGADEVSLDIGERDVNQLAIGDRRAGCPTALAVLVAVSAIELR